MAIVKFVQCKLQSENCFTNSWLPKVWNGHYLKVGDSVRLIEGQQVDPELWWRVIEIGEKELSAEQVRKQSGNYKGFQGSIKKC